MKNILLIAIALILLSNIVHAQLPEPGFTIDQSTALVITDPQVDFLSPDGVTWGVVGKNVTDNNTVKNLDRLFSWAAKNDITVFVSPHYYYPYDHKWEIEGVLEKLMHNIKMFDRKDPLSLDGFENSGADWLPQYKKYIEADNVIVVGPHKVYGPESNDLALQLRKRNFSKVLLAGMSANLCVESHMRDLVEEGFKVAVISDATAAAIVPDANLNGWEAALTNYRMIASKVFLTEDVMKMKPVGIVSSGGIFKTANELEWKPAFEGSPIQFAMTSGSTFETAHGTFAKFPGKGFITPNHIHSEGYEAIVISGTMINPMGNEKTKGAKRMGPGSFWAVPANESHTTGCVSDEPCVFYMYQSKPFDFVPVEKDHHKGSQDKKHKH